MKELVFGYSYVYNCWINIFVSYMQILGPNFTLNKNDEINPYF